MESMEVDENLANTHHQNILSETTVPDVNVVLQDHQESNYAIRLRNLQSHEDRAKYIMQLLLKDALEVGRIQQAMLLNSEVIKICQVLTQVLSVLLSQQSSYFTSGRSLTLINVDMVENQEMPFFSLISNGEFVCSLFEVSRNLFNFKMEAVTEMQFRASPEESPRLRVFKEFLYYVLTENQINDYDAAIVFRSENRFRQSTIIQYQSLDPQMKTKHFFLLLENYLLQLHVGENSSITDPMKFNNVLETDLHRRFNAVLLNFMTNTNARMEQLVVRSPFALIFTESENRYGNVRAFSYRRAILRFLQSLYGTGASAVSDFDTETKTWSMLFHARDAQHLTTMMRANDVPPNGNTIRNMLNSYRQSSFAGGFGGGGGNQWHNLDPMKLAQVLVYAFVEHDNVPPIDGSYKRGLSNFFSILMSDPIHQMFLKHLKPLYRRGWRRESLARQAAYTIVEHYVYLVVLVVQRALMMNNGQLSTTGAFLSDVDAFAPMTKMQDALRELIMTFDPIAYLGEEIGNRDSHEEKFKHHFKTYSTYVDEILQSYELWLQDTVDGYNLQGSEMSRQELFARIIVSGGFEESREQYLAGLVTQIVESDELTMENQLILPPKIASVTNASSNTMVHCPTERLNEQGVLMKEIGITIKNVGSQIMSIPEANANAPMKVEIDGNSEKANVSVDASHPNIQGLDEERLMNTIRNVLKEELAVNMREVVRPVDGDNETGTISNNNNSTSTRSYVGYTDSEIFGDLSTLVYDVNVAPADSASQIGGGGKRSHF